MAKKFVTVSRDEREYIPEDWKQDDNPLKFKFKPLSTRQLAKFADSASRMNINESTIILGTASTNIDVFRTAVSGWENFIVDDKEYPFKKASNGLIPEEVVDIIGGELVDEVANHILEQSRAGDTEMGN